MGIGNHELIEYEQDMFQELAEDFIKEHEAEWEEFKALEMEEDESMRVEEFCTAHAEWGEFVLEEYNNFKASYEDALEYEQWRHAGLGK